MMNWKGDNERYIPVVDRRDGHGNRLGDLGGDWYSWNVTPSPESSPEA